MGLGLLSAALLFVGGALICSEHYSLSERSGRGSSREQAGGRRWPEAVSGRPRAQEHQAPEEEVLNAKGSICSFFSLDSRPCLFPT